MYSSKELVLQSAKRELLNKLFTETMSDLPQKSITIQDTSQTNLADILDQIEDNDVLVTNDNYIEEGCDFKIITKTGKILVDINEDGTVINRLDQRDYVIDDSLCNILANIYDVIRHCDSICIVTDAA